MFDRSTKPERGDERGAVLVIAGFAVIALLATAAIVVDLSAARNDRSKSSMWPLLASFRVMSLSSTSSC